MIARVEQYEKITAGLAEVGYGFVDYFLSEKEIRGILALEEFVKGKSNFSKAGTGRQTNKKINESIRGDYIRWIDHSAAAAEVMVYLNRLRGLMEYINQNLFLSLKDFEVHFTIYPAGSFYQRHIDQFKRDDHRRLSVILYLNEDWIEEQGGQLRIHVPNGPVELLPVAGRLVCFRSDEIEHEVLPATRDRLSVTGWILDQLAELRHL